MNGYALDGWLEWMAKANGADQPQGSRFYLQLVLQALQQRVQEAESGLDIQRLARLEWRFLSLLDGHPTSPATLHGLLRDKPDFFVEVLGLIFRPKGESAEDALEPSEEKRLRARNAYRLLMAWKDVPGLLKDGTVADKKLRDWIDRARDQAKERRLLEVCDSRIGEVFAHAPAEADESWPCIPVRDALEDIGTEEVFSGFGIGIYNKRGVFSRGPREGGAQERALAEKYRNFAGASHLDWPRTAEALRRVADGYEEHARREDAEAEIELD